MLKLKKEIFGRRNRIWIQFNQIMKNYKNTGKVKDFKQVCKNSLQSFPRSQMITLYRRSHSNIRIRDCSRRQIISHLQINKKYLHKNLVVLQLTQVFYQVLINFKIPSKMINHNQILKMIL